MENFQGEPGEPQPTESRDDSEARRDFWSIQGDFICRHHKEPRVRLHVPKEETFPTPLKYTDVTRATYTNLDVLQEKHKDDYWNAEANRTKFIRFLDRIQKNHLIERETSKMIYVVGSGRLTKIQATTGHENVWPEVWTNIGKAA